MVSLAGKSVLRADEMAQLMSEPAIPAPPGEVSDLQHPKDALHSVNFATQMVCLVVVTIIVALRLLVKAWIRKSLELDDCESLPDFGWPFISTDY